MSDPCTAPPGAELVEDLRSGWKSSNPAGLTRVGNLLYFSANDGTHGRELWRSNGTAAGTWMVEDL